MNENEFTAVLIAAMFAPGIAALLHLWATTNAEAPADRRDWVFRAASGAFAAIRDAAERPYRWVERKTTPRAE